MTLPCAALRRPTLLIVGCGDVGLRVLRLLRGRVRVVADFEGARADEVLAQQAGIAFAFGTGRRIFALGAGQLCGCGAGGQLQIGRVEAGERLAGADLGAGIDQAGGKLAAHAEGKIEFVTGANLAAVQGGSIRAAVGRLHQDGARGWWGGLLARTGSEKCG